MRIGFGVWVWVRVGVRAGVRDRVGALGLGLRLGLAQGTSTVNWSMAAMKSVNTSGQSTREKLRRVERHCTRPTTILKMAETCRGEG